MSADVIDPWCPVTWAYACGLTSDTNRSMIMMHGASCVLYSWLSQGCGVAGTEHATHIPFPFPSSRSPVVMIHSTHNTISIDHDSATEVCITPTSSSSSSLLSPSSFSAFRFVPVLGLAVLTAMKVLHHRGLNRGS